MEIDLALQSIDDTKAPEIDELNDVFFKTTWPVIKQDIYTTIQGFLT